MVELERQKKILIEIEKNYIKKKTKKSDYIYITGIGAVDKFGLNHLIQGIS